MDFSLTHSCYDPSPEGLACGACDYCLGELEAAETHAQRALARAPDHAIANLALGMVRMKQERYEEACAALEKALGGPLPPECRLSETYAGPVRIVVPTVRTHMEPGESLALKVAILTPGAGNADAGAPAGVLCWRTMGAGGRRRRGRHGGGLKKAMWPAAARRAPRVAPATLPGMPGAG